MAVIGERVVPTPEAAGRKKAARVAVAFLLANLASRGHRQPETHPPDLPPER